MRRGLKQIPKVGGRIRLRFLLSGSRLKKEHWDGEKRHVNSKGEAKERGPLNQRSTRRRGGGGHAKMVSKEIKEKRNTDGGASEKI